MAERGVVTEPVVERRFVRVEMGSGVLVKWEQETHDLVRDWVVLEPREFFGSVGTKFTRLSDNSLLASASNPPGSLAAPAQQWPRIGSGARYPLSPRRISADGPLITRTAILPPEAASFP
jgi:hypothetical protein